MRWAVYSTSALAILGTLLVVVLEVRGRRVGARASMAGHVEELAPRPGPSQYREEIRQLELELKGLVGAGEGLLPPIIPDEDRKYEQLKGKIDAAYARAIGLTEEKYPREREALREFLAGYKAHLLRTRRPAEADQVQKRIDSLPSLDES